jgi:hypothetical protein
MLFYGRVRLVVSSKPTAEIIFLGNEFDVTIGEGYVFSDGAVVVPGVRVIIILQGGIFAVRVIAIVENPNFGRGAVCPRKSNWGKVVFTSW